MKDTYYYGEDFEFAQNMNIATLCKKEDSNTVYASSLSNGKNKKGQEIDNKDLIIEGFDSVAFAIAIGFAFIMCFYKSGSLIPCILTHSIIYLSSKFSNHHISAQAEAYWNYSATAFIILVAGAYALYLRKVALSEKSSETNLNII